MTIPAFCSFELEWYIYFNLFDLPVSLHLGWVSQRDYIIWSSFYIPSHMFSHLMGTLRLLNFKVIIAILGLSSTIHVTVFYFLSLSFVCVCVGGGGLFLPLTLLLPSLLLIEQFTGFHLLPTLPYQIWFAVHIYVGAET